MSQILPPRLDEGEDKNLTIRIPEKVLESIDRISKKSGWSRTNVILHFLRWAVQEYDAEQADEKKPRR